MSEVMIIEAFEVTQVS